MPRSAERQAEIKVMDRIEAAMAGIDELSEAAQQRVRAWHAAEYAQATTANNGAAVTLAGVTAGGGGGSVGSGGSTSGAHGGAGGGKS